MILVYSATAGFKLPITQTLVNIPKDAAAQLAVDIVKHFAGVKSATDAQTEQTLALLRVAITDGLVKKCHAVKDETKSIYRQQVAEAQARYYRLTGAYYPEHSCADL